MRGVAITIPIRPIGFFVHHQGHGHVRRASALIEQMPARPVTVFCARPDLFAIERSDVSIVALPDFHCQPPATSQLLNQPSSTALDCAPLGVGALRNSMGILAQWFREADPALFVVDVSAEVALLARICSVPTVKIRMHGNRGDLAHDAAYSASVALLAPFDERLEQPEFPCAYRAKTEYIGGLVGQRKPPRDRAAARQRLGLPQDRMIVVTLSGGGGLGANIGSLTVAARAYPDALWLLIGLSARRGHETDFRNLQLIGWVDNTLDYICAADVVVAPGGDNTVHEIAQVGRPFICIPEWCYYAEQECKAQALARLGVAVYSPTWPADFGAWRALVEQARACDLDVQRSLTCEHAAVDGARFLDQLANTLWAENDAACTEQPWGRSGHAAASARRLTSSST